MSILKKLLVATAGASFVTLGATATVQAVTLTSTADSYISRNEPNTNYGQNSQLLVKSDNSISSNSNFDRKAYVRFDLSSITSPSLTSATFSLTGLASGAGTLNNNSLVSTFNVYGLTSLTNNAQTLAENSITWNNAPANDGTDAGVTPGNPLVGTFNVTGTGAGTTYSISNPGLLAFLNTRINAADNNNLATFIITRPTTSSAIGDYVHAFNSEEAFAGNLSSEPTLVVTAGATAVPFEFSPGLGILALGAWGAVAQLKSKVKNRKPLKVTCLTDNYGQPESV